MHILWIYDYNRQPSLNNLKVYVDIGVLLSFHGIIILSYCILFMKTRQSGVLCIVWTVPRPISSRQWLWSKALGLTTPKVPRLLAAPCVKLSNNQASVSSLPVVATSFVPLYMLPHAWVKLCPGEVVELPGDVDGALHQVLVLHQEIPCWQPSWVGTQWALVLQKVPSKGS